MEQVLIGIELVSGSPLPPNEQEDYMALWRYIGWVLGVETRGEIDPCRSVPHAKASLESIIMHLLLQFHTPTHPPVTPLLRAT